MTDASGQCCSSSGAPCRARGARARTGQLTRWLTALALAALLVAVGACGSGGEVPPAGPAGGGGEARSLPLEDAVGQMLLIGFPGERLGEETVALLDDIAPGGVILFDYDLPSGGAQPRNITSPMQVRALIAELQAQAKIAYFIAIDVEGGLVNRLKPAYGFGIDLPSHQALGAGAAAATGTAAAAAAAELRQLGINWNLAPVVDVNVFPESPAIGALERSFSADPEIVAAHAAAFAGAHAAAGVISTLKHFPGHGSAAGDTHLGVTDVTSSYVREDELAPYRLLIEEGYGDAVMTAHVVNRDLDPSGRPATLSGAIVTGLLREALGFRGVILADDMQMGAIVERYSIEGAAVEAIKAGVDVIPIANQLSADLTEVYRVKRAILEAVAEGAISEDRIYESVERILSLKRRYGLIE